MWCMIYWRGLSSMRDQAAASVLHQRKTLFLCIRSKWGNRGNGAGLHGKWPTSTNYLTDDLCSMFQLFETEGYVTTLSPRQVTFHVFQRVPLYVASNADVNVGSSNPSDGWGPCAHWRWPLENFLLMLKVTVKHTHNLYCSDLVSFDMPHFLQHMICTTFLITL